MWCLIMHKWTKWQDLEQGSIYVDGDKKKPPYGKFLIQERVCKRCNKRERVKQQLNF